MAVNNNIENVVSLQKVALVTGMGYDQAEDLSIRYPFALFFTDGEIEDGSIASQYHASLIIKNGVKFTRFIDVDSSRDTLQINDHVIKLSFDPDSGLISIGDAYTLSGIEFVSLSYIGITNTNEVIQWDNEMGGAKIVDARDNKFNLKVKFYSNDDVTKISKSLLFSPLGQYIQYISYDTDINGSIATYYFNALKDYNNRYDVTATSSYSHNISNIFSFDKIRVNPQYIDVYLDGDNINYKSNVYIENNKEYDVEVVLSADLRSMIFSNLIIQVTSTNEDIVYFTSSIKYGSPISNNVIKFTLYGGEGTPNQQMNASFTIKIYRDIISNYNEYTYLRKTYNAILGGENVDTYWYIGTVNPLIDLNINLRTLQGVIGETLQYDYVLN